MKDATAVTGWEKPGPGAWTHDSAHSTGPVTRLLQGVFPAAMADGFRSFTGRYGLPISHIEVRYVNGYAYGAVRIAGVPPSDRPPPPAWLLRGIDRACTPSSGGATAATDAFERRLWRDDLHRWFDVLRPARLASLRALQAVDPATLDDAELAAHVAACAAELGAGLREHFSLVGASGLPVGVYVLREAARGRSAADALGGLRGAAARSTGATMPALAAIADALDDAGIKARTLDDVRRASPAARAALDAYLEEYGERVVGALDVTGRRLVELPDVVLRSIAAAKWRTAPVDAETDGNDPVVDDARLAVASRDDHAGVSCMWPLGLVRRALLAAGSRLHDAGLVERPDHVFDCAAGEVVALLRREPGAATRQELEARAEERSRRVAADPPLILGELHVPPDPALFPPGIRRMSSAMAAFLGSMESRTASDARGAGVGIGVGDAAHRGRAVVAVDPEDAIDRLEPGDVLVTTTTTPAFNCVLPVAGALVTADGGLMSHAGIAARELGIPAVLGVSDALVRIPDGAVVEVDPVAGTVHIVP